MDKQTNKVSQKIIDKIRNLLVLAEDHRTNENEAGVAALKAGELLSKYNLEIDDLGEESEISHEVVLEDYVMANWKGLLFSGISSLYGVEIINTFKKRRSKRGRLIMIGRPVSILIAKETFFYLSNVIERLALSYQGKGYAHINSFRIGIGERLRQKLEAKRNELNHETRGNGALVVKSQFEKDMEAINEYLKHLFGAVEESGKARYSSKEAYQDGLKIADTISLNEQITHTQASSSSRLALPSARDRD